MLNEITVLALMVDLHLELVGIGISNKSFKTSQLHAAPSVSCGVLSLLGGNK